MHELEEILQEPIENTPPSFFMDSLHSLDRSILLKSVREFGTPQYILDREQLQKRALYFSRVMRQYIPNSDFFYAFKCNDLPYLIAGLKEVGFFADVAGIFELQLALELGFEKIVFSSPGKNISELKLAIKHKNRVVINVDNFDELYRIKEIVGNKNMKEKIPLGFRLNSEPFLKGEWSKFGFELEELIEAVQIVNNSPNLEWVGLHFHCSWNKTPLKYLENIKHIGTFLSRNFSAGVLKNLRFFDIGGGYYPEKQAVINKIQDKGILLDTIGVRRGNKYQPFEEMKFDPFGFTVTNVEPLENFAKGISEALKEYIFPLNPDINIYFEPGRFVVSFATHILLEVMAVKKNCVIADGGIHMLGDYKFSEYSFAPIVNLSRFSTDFRRTIIYGPLCDPNDLWGHSYYGEEIRKGDILAVLFQGAYTYCTAWRFIKPIPPYIAFSGGKLILAKPEEDFSHRYPGLISVE